jgi:hypothetical protein
MYCMYVELERMYEQPCKAKDNLTNNDDGYLYTLPFPGPVYSISSPNDDRALLI